jgi:hypothetical protein
MDSTVRPLIEETLQIARQHLEAEEASERFTELFAEIVTVAAVARHTYHDPPLSDHDIESYEQQSSSFLNSFRHA